MLGYAPDECVGLSWVELLAENNPAEAVQACTDMIAGLRPCSQQCLSFVRKDGVEVILESSALFRCLIQPVGFAATGASVGTSPKTQAHRRRQGDSRANCCNRKRWEVVGRLAGGVTRFQQHADRDQQLCGNDLKRTGGTASALQTAVRGAQGCPTSADLTRQLLAFARKRVAPRILDLNETISGSLKMLHRLIGENIDLQWNPWPQSLAGADGRHPDRPGARQSRGQRPRRH